MPVSFPTCGSLEGSGLFGLFRGPFWPRSQWMEKGRVATSGWTESRSQGPPLQPDHRAPQLLPGGSGGSVRAIFRLRSELPATPARARAPAPADTSLPPPRLEPANRETAQLPFGLGK